MPDIALVYALTAHQICFSTLSSYSLAPQTRLNATGAPLVRRLLLALQHASEHASSIQQAANQAAAGADELVRAVSHGASVEAALASAQQVRELATQTARLASMSSEITPDDCDDLWEALDDDACAEMRQRQVRQEAHRIDGHQDVFLGSPGGDVAHLLPKSRREVRLSSSTVQTY